MPFLLLRAPAHVYTHSLVHHTQTFLRGVFLCSQGRSCVDAVFKWQHSVLLHPEGGCMY